MVAFIPWWVILNHTLQGWFICMGRSFVYIIVLWRLVLTIYHFLQSYDWWKWGTINTYPQKTMMHINDVHVLWGVFYLVIKLSYPLWWKQLYFGNLPGDILSKEASLRNESHYTETLWQLSWSLLKKQLQAGMPYIAGMGSLDIWKCVRMRWMKMIRSIDNGTYGWYNIISHLTRL